MRLIKCVLVRIAVATKCVRLLDWSGLGAKLFRVLNGPQNRAGSLLECACFERSLVGRSEGPYPYPQIQKNYEKLENWTKPGISVVVVSAKEQGCRGCRYYCGSGHGTISFCGSLMRPCQWID